VSVEEFDTRTETVDRLYGQYKDKLRIFFKSKWRKQPAEDDFVQLVFVRLLKYPRLQEIRDPERFLYKIAWSVLNTENRRLKYERPLPVDTDPQESKNDRTTPRHLWQDGIDAVDHQTDLERALDKFTAEQRTVFLLRWKYGYTFEEISRLTETNIHTVRKYAYRTMFELRKLYVTDIPGDL